GGLLCAADSIVGGQHSILLWLGDGHHDSDPVPALAATAAPPVLPFVRATSAELRGRVQPQPPVRPWVEHLEDRTLLSTILWTNKGDAVNDSDHFNQVFRQNANVARGVVQALLVGARDDREKREKVAG